MPVNWWIGLTTGKKSLFLPTATNNKPCSDESKKSVPTRRLQSKCWGMIRSIRKWVLHRQRKSEDGSFDVWQECDLISLNKVRGQLGHTCLLWRCKTRHWSCKAYPSTRSKATSCLRHSETRTVLPRPTFPRDLLSKDCNCKNQLSESSFTCLGCTPTAYTRSETVSGSSYNERVH